jgi:hypothetical protein
MTRLNLEDRLFIGIQLDKVAQKTGVDKFKILGHLCYLWYSSQNVHIYHCKKDDIIIYGKFTAEMSTDNMFLALCEAGFLKEENKGYHINGNLDHIEAIQKYRKTKSEAGQKGGIESGKSRRKSKSKNNKSKQNEAGASSETKQVLEANEAISLHNISLHNISLHDNTSHCTTVQTTEILSDVEDNSKTREINKRSGSSLVVENISPTKSKNKIPEKWISQISGDDRLLADMWLNHAKEMSTSKKVKLSQDDFSLAVCKMRVEHGLRLDQIEHVLHFVSTDEFWRGKALSPMSLLRPSKSDPTIPKLEQVIRQIKNKKLSPIEKSLQVLNTTDFSIDIVEEILKGE